MRLKLIGIGITICFIAVACGLIYTQLIQGRYYYELSVNNRIRLVALEGQRGRIKDRNGVILADNRLVFNVSVIPQEVRSEERLFQFLSESLKTDKKKLLKIYQQRRVAPFAPVVVAEGIDKTLAMVLEENKFLYPGLDIEESLIREYPFEKIGAHVLGYVGKINPEKIEKLKEYGYTHESVIGKSGVEEYYDALLKGTTGGQQIEVNNRGQQVRLLNIRQPSHGQDIQLTLDNRIQEAAVNLLGDRHGSIVVMDLQSGEILGLISSPSFDPNVFVDSEKKKNAGLLFIDEDSPLLNRAIQGAYPPGSVFKTVVTLAGLLSEKIGLSTSFDCGGFFKLGRRRWHCMHTHGTQDLMQGFTHSCNVYFFHVGELIGPELMHNYAKMLGLGELSGIDLPFEEKGNVPSPLQRRMKSNQGWFKGDTLNYAIGQGDLLVSPIQVMRMMATIARDGQEIQPYLLKGIGSKEIVSLAATRKIPVKPRGLETLQAALRSVVSDSAGTARILNIEGLEVSGKTGTAQTTASKDSHAWFAGYTSQGKVKIAFCIFLEYGGSSYNAVVVTKDLLKQMQEMEIL